MRKILFLLVFNFELVTYAQAENVPDEVISDGFSDAASAYLDKHPHIEKCVDKMVDKHNNERRENGLEERTTYAEYGEFIGICATILLDNDIQKTETVSILDWRNVELSNGLVYSGKQNTPFTGKLTNFKIKPIDYYYSINFIAMLYDNDLGKFGQDFNFIAMGYPNRLDKVSFSQDFFCDMSVKNGVLDGEFICYVKNSRVKRLAGGFKEGVINGELKLYSLETGTVTVSCNISKGFISGYYKSYTSDGLLVAERYFKNGEYDGEQKIWNPSTAKLASFSIWHNGMIDKESVRQWNYQTGEEVKQTLY